MDTCMNAREIAEIIMNSDNIVISSHTGPDGDAIGSVSALYMALKKFGKKVVAVIEVLPHRFSQIEGAGLINFEIPEDFVIKTFIALDCADKSRLGRFEKSFESSDVRINIDHHASNNLFGNVNFVDGFASAASEMVYDILESSRELGIDKSIASALYAGILYDTGGFRHPNTSSGTYYKAGKLIDYGAEFSEIYNKLVWTKRFEEIRILATAFNNMKQEHGGRFVWTSITSEELSRANAKASDLDSIVEYCKSIEGCEIAAFIYQKDEKEFKISLRSNPGYDVSEIAIKLGGGGHKNAAGATYCGELEKCVEEVSGEIEETLSRGGHWKV